MSRTRRKYRSHHVKWFDQKPDRIVAGDAVMRVRCAYSPIPTTDGWSWQLSRRLYYTTDLQVRERERWGMETERERKKGRVWGRESTVREREKERKREWGQRERYKVFSLSISMHFIPLYLSSRPMFFFCNFITVFSLSLTPPPLSIYLTLAL